MSRTRLLRTTSFRLATIYLALFTASALALSAFVYLSIRHEILADFDERIVEETDALQTAFAKGGRERLEQILEARGEGGGGFSYGLEGPGGTLLSGELRAPAGGAGGWMEAREAEDDEAPEAKPEIVRALATRLSDGSILVVGDEQRRSNEILRGVLSAFGWAVAATLALGTIGGLWLSAQFLSRIDSMRLTARRLMAGDWSRRIPLSPVDDDLTALARTFNRLFDRIEKLLIANKQVSADIAHDLRKPLASMLRRLEAARDGDASPASVSAAIEAAIAEIEGVLETFNALLRIGQVEAGARRAAFRPLNLAEVAREVVEAFQPAAEEEGKTLVARLDAPLPMSGDKELVVQMIANLLDNALRHTPPGAGIEVAGKRTQGGISLTVVDDGPGVAPDELKAIFQRFYRAEAARTPAGTGLGLSLVAAIAELHGLECAASDNCPGLRVTLTTADEEE
ncbi:MAG TPA: ATP-binding protein [Roseiarcus sp.]|nr:ATP-binding protein [Roseiarcus sp.]